MEVADKAKKQVCNHRWSYPHGTIDGKKPGWFCIVRECDECCLRQMAKIPPTSWEKAKGDYALEEHYR